MQKVHPIILKVTHAISEGDVATSDVPSRGYVDVNSGIYVGTSDVASGEYVGHLISLLRKTLAQLMSLLGNMLVQLLK